MAVNVLSDSEKNQFLSRSWQPADFNPNGVKFGTPYALSVTYDSSADGLWLETRFNYWTTDGSYRRLSDTVRINCAKGKHSVTVTIPSFNKPDDFARAVFIVRAGDISGKGTIEISRPMLVEGTKPAAWAPAEGETLAGEGALMSANLVDGKSPILSNGATYIDGVYTFQANEQSKARSAIDILTPDTSVLADNQTCHFGYSVKVASGASYSGYPAVRYADAAGNVNYVGKTVTATGTGDWQRVETSFVVPSGMRVDDCILIQNGKQPTTYVTGIVLSYGSPVTLAISSSTLAWSAGILATVRYYQLASPTSATPAVPASSSDLGAWSETEPEADVTKVLWTCERTVYADGTESWSKASKSTSYEAAKDAKSTATDAQQKAQTAQEQVVDVSTRLDQNTDNLTATIESKVTLVQQDVDSNTNDVSELNKRLTSEIKARRSFMRFSEESSDPTLTLGQTNSPAQVKLTNKQLQFLYLNTVVAYMSGDALLINNAKILQQLQLGGFAFVPRDNGNLAFKWVGGDS